MKSATNRELVISRVIDAPPARIWKAWSTPEHLAKWWIPAPIECQVVKLDLHPGGGFETRMRQAGESAFKPHVEGCFLEIKPELRLVWTTCLGEGWKPITPWLALSADISFEAEGAGTRYTARVMHRSDEDARKHEEMGFHEGWGTAIDQLAAFVAANE
jgi:uncharacterized protein YndB with AHSA1/START domain